MNTNEWDVLLQSKLTNMTNEERIQWSKNNVILYEGKTLTLDFEKSVVKEVTLN